MNSKLEKAELNNDSVVDLGTVCRPLFAGVFVRGMYPEKKPFYITNAFILEEPVCGRCIKLAWNKTIQVYPYFSKAVVKRDRAYYLAENPLDFVICETEDVIEPATAEGNYHAVTICYKDHRIAFYIDHVVTDGTAIRMVLATFFYYYYCAFDGTGYPVPEGVRTIENGVSPDQEADAYLMVDTLGPMNSAAGKTDGETFQYPEDPKEKSKTELLPEDGEHFLLQVPSDEFMTYAKSAGGSPSSVLVQLVCQSLERENPGNELPLSILVPISVRAAMENRNSLLHQIVHMTYQADPKMLSDQDSMSFNRDFRTHLKQISNSESIHYLCGLYRGIIEGFQKAISVDMLDQVIKRNEKSQNALSACVSFLGTLAAGDYGSRIHMESFRVMPEKEILVYMMEIGGQFYISFNIGAKTERYVLDMERHMKELGMEHVQIRTVP